MEFLNSIISQLPQPQPTADSNAVWYVIGIIYFVGQFGPPMLSALTTRRAGDGGIERVHLTELQSRDLNKAANRAAEAADGIGELASTLRAMTDSITAMKEEIERHTQDDMEIQRKFVEALENLRRRDEGTLQALEQLIQTTARTERKMAAL